MAQPRPTPEHRFVETSGVAGQRPSSYPQAATANGVHPVLGEVDAWPPSLKTALDILLPAGSPMFLVWGCDRLFFYNDALANDLGENPLPAAWGQPLAGAADGLGLLGAAVEQVFASGQSLKRQPEASSLALDDPGASSYRWTYSPLWDEAGHVGGVFATGCRVEFAEPPTPPPEAAPPPIEEMLRQQEDQLRLITSALPILIAYIDKNHVYRFNSQTYEAWFGQPVAALANRPVRDVLGEAAYAVVLPYIEQVLSGQRVTYESPVPYQHGGTRYIKADYVPHINSQGDVEGYISLVSDLSEHKRAEIARQQAETVLREREADFQAMFNVTSVGMAQADPKTGQILRANAAFCAITGYTEAELLTLRVDDINHPDDRQQDRARFASLLRGEATLYQAEKRYLRQDGQTVWVSVTGNVIHDEAGEPARIVAVLQDITERKQAEANLRKSKERFRLVTRAVNGLVFDWNLQTNDIYRSEKLYDLVGVHPEDVPGGADWWQQRLHPEDVTRLQPYMAERLASSHDVYAAEYRVRHEDGHWVDVWEQGCLIRDEQGQVSRIVGCTVDISERQAALRERQRVEAALREKERQLQQLSDSMPHFVWFCSATGALEYINRQWLEYSGLTLEQTRDQGLLEAVCHPDDAGPVFEGWTAALETQQPFEVEARLRRVDGAYRWFLIRAVPGFDHQGQVGRWYGTSTDIHTRKRRELHDQFLNQLDARLRQLTDVRAVVWETVSSLGDYLDLSRCAFVEIDWTQGLATVERDWCREVPSMAGTCRISDFITPEFQAEMAAGQVARVHDVTTDPRTAAFADQYEAADTRAFANAPCIYQGTWVADLTISSKTPRVWREDEVALLQQTIARVWPLIEQTKAVQALRDSEERLQMALEGSGGGLWDWEISTDTSYKSPRWLGMLGYQEGDLPDSVAAWENLIHPEDRAWVLEQTRAHLQDDSVPYKFEYRLRSKSGDWKWIASYGRVVQRDAQGQPLRMAGIHHDVNDRKQAELALRQSEERYRYLVEVTPHLVWTADAQGRNTYVSQQMVDYIGLPADQLLQLDWGRVVHPEDADRIHHRWMESVQTGLPYDAEYRLRRADGTYSWQLVRALPHRDEGGHIVQWFGVSIDISDRKYIEAEREQLLQDLAIERAQFEAVLRRMPAGVFIARAPSGQLVLGNQQAEQIWRHPVVLVSEMNQYFQYRGFHADGRPYAPEEWPLARSLMSGEVVTQEEILFIRGDGTEGVMEASSTPIYNSQGQITSGVVIFQDITERKHIEEALRISEERLRFAVEGAALGTWEYDLASSQIVWSERAKQMFGVPLDAEVDYELFMQTIHPDDRDRIHATAEDAIAQQSVYDVEMRSLWPDGSVRWIRSIGRARYTPSGRPIRMMGVSLDITERKQAEEDLRESERRFRRLVESNMFGVAFGDFTGGIHYANDYFFNLIGYTQEEIEANQIKWMDITPPEFLPLDEQAGIELRQRGVATPFEKEYIHKNGTRVPILIGSALLQEPYNQHQEIIAFYLDLTERKRAEIERERLLQQAQAAREEAETANRIKDEFLAVLSHELRSPLNPILGWAKLLQTGRFAHEAMQQGLQTIERNAKLQTQLIEDLLDVSRILRGKLTLNVYPVNLVTVIEAALETVRLAADAKQIRLQTHIPFDIVQTLGDAARLQQIVWNLLSNAVKFTPEGGQVDVSLEQIDRYAHIQVKDTGKGISSDFLPYVFDYFRQEDGKTTRKFGGLGLGLAIVRHLTELHGGRAAVASDGDEQGAVFTIQLPLITITPGSGEADPAAPSVDLSPFTILLVDDEADMRELAQVILEQYGAQVTVVSSAADALAVFERQPPDIFISDIGMPEVDGYMLMQQIRARPPEKGGQVSAIALTAYAGDQDQQRALQAGFQRHLAKPVEPDDLIQAIADLTGSP